VIPEQISHGGSQGFKSPHLHPTTCSSERRQRRAGGAHCTLRPQHGRKRRSQSSQEGLQRPGDSTLGLTRRPRSVVATSLRRPAPLPAGDPRTHPASSAATRSTDHCSTPSRGDGQVQANASAGPAGLRQPRSPGSDSGSRGAGRGHSGRLRARPSQPCGYLPTASLHDLPVGHSGHGSARTPDTHPWTGHWTADTGRSDAHTGHRTASRGQARVDVVRSHRTPDAARDVDRVTKARPVSEPPGPPRLTAAAWDAQPCSSGQCSRRLATMTTRQWATYQRETAARTTRQLLGRSAAARGASAHCCPRTITGRA
jgi:hypothetical protein